MYRVLECWSMMWRGRSRLLRAKIEASGLEFFMRRGSRILQCGLRVFGGVVRKSERGYCGVGRKLGVGTGYPAFGGIKNRRLAAQDLPLAE